MPWLGERKDAPIVNVIREFNVIIKNLAIKYDITLLDLFKKIEENIEDNNNITNFDVSIPYTTSEIRRLRGLRAVILYYVFGWSWNDIGKKYNLQFLCDHIHLNERGGYIMEDLVRKFLYE